MEEIIVHIWFIICGCICIWKGLYSSSKTERLKTFLKNQDDVYQVDGVIRVVKIEYHSHHKFDDYIVNITFTDFRGKKISIMKTFNDSLCSTEYLRKNKKKTGVPTTVFYHRENPEECIVEELKELEYVKGERWIMLLVGVLFILLGGILIYYHQ